MFKRNYFVIMLTIILTIFLISCSSNTQTVTQTAETQITDTNDDKISNDLPDDAPKMNGEKPDGPPPDNAGGPPEKKGLQNNIEYKSVNHYNTSDTYDELVLSSTEKDESAVLVDSNAYVTLNDFEINRTNNKSTGGDNASFYGVGSATLVTSGTLNLNEGIITTNANGGAGVFAYGQGIANVNGTTIETKKGASGGIHVAGGGRLNATELTVTTNGESSAPIRSDRGGGKMTVNSGSFTSNGTGSPAIYCTADITVNDATLVANKSEGICIEGLNTTTLNSVELT